MAQVGPVVAVGENSTRISVGVEITKIEAEIIELSENHPLLLNGTVVINTVPEGQRQRVNQIEGNDVQFLRNLFGVKYQDDSMLGVVDHIGADRRFAGTQVTSINFSDDHAETKLQRLVANSSDKFQSLTQDLVMMYMLDMHDRERQVEPPSNYLDGVREIFGHFLPDRQFLGIDMPPDFRGRPRALVRSSGVTHDIDQLSSGQREILMTYTHLEKLRPTGSIILFDEPELHLHPALQRRVISHLQRLLERASNQIWLITHSEEIVGTAEYESLFSTTTHGSPALMPVSSKAERVELLQSLGASIGLQLTSPRILFLEGESDAEILPLLFETLPAGLSLVSTGGKGNLMRLTETAMELMESVIRGWQFFLIRDKDVEDTTSVIDQLANRYSNNFFVWNRYHIENYLLDEIAIREVLMDDEDIPNPAPLEEINSQLRSIADLRRDSVLAKVIETRLNRELRTRLRLNPKEGVLPSLEKATAKRLRRTNELLDASKVHELFNESERDLSEHWDDEWKSLCIGRDVLSGFHNLYVREYLGYEVFRNRIARQLRMTRKVPRDIIEVMVKVTDGLDGQDNSLND